MKRRTSVDLIGEVSKIVNQIAGIQLGAEQRSMVKQRLSKRLSNLGFEHPEDYLHYLQKNLEREAEVLVSILTTHHSSFFREFKHFEYLRRSGLSRLISAARKENRKHLRIWSAASSQGQEAYSLAMFFDHELKKLAPDFTFEILASDVDPQSISYAQNGVYRLDDLKDAPSEYTSGRWIRGTEAISDFVKAKASIKDCIRFETINLTEIDSSFITSQFDLIFCRNVFIYFTADQVRTILDNVLQYLNEEGLLIIGLTENLNGLELPLVNLGPSVFGHQQNTFAFSAKITPKKAPPPFVPLDASKRVLRVLAIDDSPSILIFLKKILSKERGFEIVATASNGLEAAKLLPQVNPDVVTLDLHMPEQDGFEYLKQNFGPHHPPVLVMSSVAVEDRFEVDRALKLGASDFIQKPSLQDLERATSEICEKLRRVADHEKRELPDSNTASALTIQKDFSPTESLRVIWGNSSSYFKIQKTLAKWEGLQPPLLLILKTSVDYDEKLADKFKGFAWKRVPIISNLPSRFESGTLYVMEYRHWCEVHSKFRAAPSLKVSVMIFGEIEESDIFKLPNATQRQILVEELPYVSEAHRKLEELSPYILPYTSFHYHSDLFFRGDKK